MAKSKGKKAKAKNDKQLVGVSAPVVKATVNKGARAPMVTYASDGSCSISHMEYVQDANISVNGSAIALACNAQSSEMFTWLSAIASRFEMYRFKKLVYHFKTSCSTTTDGFAVIGFDFDAYDEAPGKAAMLAWKYVTKGAVWNNISLNVSSDSRMSTWRYCNQGTPTGGDKRLDVLGNLFTLIQGGTTNKNVGEIYVEYICEFRQPSYKLPPVYSFKATSSGWDNTNDFFGGVTTKFEGNMPYFVNTGQKLVVPVAGKFLIDVFCSGGGISSAITVNGTQAIEYPNASWVLTALETVFSPGGSFANSTFVLDVPVGGVLLTFSVTGSTITNSIVRFATYVLGS